MENRCAPQAAQLLRGGSIWCRVRCCPRHLLLGDRHQPGQSWLSCFQKPNAQLPPFLCPSHHRNTSITILWTLLLATWSSHSSTMSSGIKNI